MPRLSGQDTDWTAKLVDVHPDGYVQNIQDGIIRARYRAGRKARFHCWNSGKVYEYDIDLWATSNTFLPGHRSAWKSPAAISRALTAT
ncbi:MAG: CocE/NonD family hydrolase C-terminal non-catalytic domain-containing protein [Steroidobacteraceae bacterium]